jgi:type II secretion system-associated lipoprotein
MIYGILSPPPQAAETKFHLSCEFCKKYSMKHMEFVTLRRSIFYTFALVLAMTACDVFVTHDEIDFMKGLQNKVYILKKDFDVEGKKLKRGEDIKIVITPKTGWIKVHAYQAKANELKADRVLILYLFEEDFPKKLYNREFFLEQLNAVAGVR